MHGRGSEDAFCEGVPVTPMRAYTHRRGQWERRRWEEYSALTKSEWEGDRRSDSGDAEVAEIGLAVRGTRMDETAERMGWTCADVDETMGVGMAALR